jgi:guanylate kinase
MKILTLTGPSCSGKTTLLNKLVAEHGFQNVVSHTTRPPRPGEVDGVDYHFVPVKIFEGMKSDSEFLENVSFNGFSYGVSRDEILKAHDSGKIAALIVEPNGLAQMKEYAKGGGIEIVPVYIGGDINDLMARYLKRMAGEDLLAEGVAERHAKRLQSMIAEQRDWQPDENYAALIGGKAMWYKLVLDEYTPHNEQVIIDIINDFTKNLNRK